MPLEKPWNGEQGGENCPCGLESRSITTADNRRPELFGSAQTVINDNSLHWPEELKTAKKMGNNQKRGKAFAFERRSRTKAIPAMVQAQLKTTAWRQPEKQLERQPTGSQKSRQKGNRKGRNKGSWEAPTKADKMVAGTTIREAARITKKTAAKANRTTA
jgi:hypothetical protein